MSTTLRDQAYGILCGLVLEDGRPWTESAAAYQRTHALAILDPDDPVKQTWITLPRAAGRPPTWPGS
jgi:hypothetical protein